MKYLMPAALAVVMALAVACGGDDDNATQTPAATQTSAAVPTNTTQGTGTAAPTSTAEGTGTGEPTASGATTPTGTPGANVCQPNPNPATADQTVVTSPQPGAQVTSPVTVAGQINAFEAQFNISIRNAYGSDIATMDGHSQEGQTLSAFSQIVPFTVTEPTPACVWVFDVSPADGVSPIQVVQVPVTLVP